MIKRIINWFKKEWCLHKHPKRLILGRASYISTSVSGIYECEIDGQLSYMKTPDLIWNYININIDKIPKGRWINSNNEEVIIK